MAEAALLKAVRSLDQGGPETVDSKLGRLWDTLVATSANACNSGGRFHASEEVALRWLLKNMHTASGTASPEVETLRRWPLTWRIIACTFRRIPLFSLAKSLADRRFVVVLLQTARDLETPTTPTTAPSETQDGQHNSRKRKRWQEAQYDLGSLREPQQCVVSAAALFSALRVLLSRLDENGERRTGATPFSSYSHMGAEHIKSFFCISASDAMTLLVPLLQICDLALTAANAADDDGRGRGSGESGTFEEPHLDGQETWISTLSTLWELHLQGPTDAVDMATHLAQVGLAMLGRLLSIPSSAPSAAGGSLNPEVRRRWSIGLQRLFTNGLVLPARSAFLNRKDIHTLVTATSTASAQASVNEFVVRSSAIFYITLKAPRLLAGGGTSSKDNELWVQMVFERIREPLMAATKISAHEKNNALAGLLNMATQHGMAPSIESLHLICKKCALPSSEKGYENQTTDWRLVASIAHCNADVFLFTAEGEQLLNSVLQQLSLPSSAPQSLADCQFASAFLISLAQGFATARNLSGFITRWYSSITALGASISSPQVAQNVWLRKDLRVAVAETLQSSLTKEQLLFLIAHVGLKDADSASSGDKELAAAGTVARLVIFDAISAGIHVEELEDAVQAKMLDSVLGLDLSSKLASEILAIQWRLTRRTLAWVGFSEAERIWATAKTSMKRLASSKRKSPMLSEENFEAFVCCFSLWMALRFGDQEQETREITWTFFMHFQEELSNLIREESGRTELLQEVSRHRAVCDEVAGFWGGSFGTKAASVGSYLTWMICGSSRFIDEMVKSGDGPSNFLEGLLAWQSGLNSKDGSPVAWIDISALVFSNTTNLQNQKITSNITENCVKHLEEAAGKQRLGLQDAILALLHTPTHLLTRSLRERIVSILLPPRQKSAKAFPLLTFEEAVLILDLLTRVTRERAFGDLDFDRLVYLGEIIQAVVESTPLQSALGVFDRFQQVARAVIRSTACRNDCQISESIPSNLQIVLSKAKLLALKDSSTSNSESAQLLEIKESLSSIVVKQLLGYLDNKEDVCMSGTLDVGDGFLRLPLPLLLTFDAAMADDIQPQLVQQKKFGSLIKKMKKTADALCSQNQKVGWKWRAFVARYTCNQESKPPREVLFQGLFLDGNDHTDLGIGTHVTAASVFLDSDLLRDYLAGETKDYSQEALLLYIGELIAALGGEPNSPIGQLLAIQYLLVRLFDTSGAATSKGADGFHLGIVHSKLAQRLPLARSITECKLLAQTLRTLLVVDKSAAAMGQWNIDTTLSAAAVMVSLNHRPKGEATASEKTDVPATNDDVRESVVAYDGACQLVEAVLKRHRVRLEGRFHLVVGTLQALLVRLAVGHQAELKKKARTGIDTGSNTATTWAPQAKRFARLLELICEPSTAAVTMTARKGEAGTGAAAPLHSATDVAKRSAGQHMYLVLMAYIKLQVDGAVFSRSVREALEPGLFSILSVTPDEKRRLLNDAVDASGRALFKDLYRTWLQFGKWKGV